VDNPLHKALNGIVEAVDRAGEKWHAAMQAGLAQTERAVRLRGARNKPLTGTGLVQGGPSRLAGWSLLNTGANPLTVAYYDADSAGATDTFLGGDTIPAGASSTKVLPGPGVSASYGVYAVVTGTAPAYTGTTYFGAVD
jgi:hypothetical protein